MITVVGIGIDRGDITQKGKRAIKEADYVFARSKNAYADEVASVIFADSSSFDEMNERIANRLKEKEAEGKNVVYLARGDGYTDAVVGILGSDVTVIGGVADNRGRKYGASVVSMSAYEINGETYFDTSLPHIIYDIDDKDKASDVKLCLLDYYDGEEEVTLCWGKSEERIPLFEIDRKRIKDACLYLDAKPEFLGKKRYEINDLMRIMRRLTAPNGCPWDKEQTHESIRINMIEEAYEAVDAIDTGDTDNLIEELGDVLLQVVFHCDMSNREGEFDFNDVVSGVCEKLVSRHTHIFGDVIASDAEGALSAWDKAKEKEKHVSTYSEQIDRLPSSFPATLFTQKMIKKAKKYGASISEEQIFTKLREEIEKKNGERILFLSCVYATLLGLDVEVELNKSAKQAYEKAKQAEKDGSMSALGEKL